MEKKTNQTSPQKIEKPVIIGPEQVEPVKLFVGGLTGDTTNRNLLLIHRGP